MIDKLQKLGLSEKESVIYLALARLGKTTANELAKKTSSNRTVTYNILQQLSNKGFVSYKIKNGKRLYNLSNPKSLLVDIEEKKEIAKSLVIEISKMHKKSKEKNNVEIYESLQGLKSVFQEIRNSKNLRVLNATGLIFKHLKFSAGHVLKDIELSGNVKVIANPKVKETELSNFKRIKFKYLPEIYQNYATTFIFDNKVIIQTLKDTPFLVKIESPDIYEGYKKDFDLIWKFLN